MAEEYDLGKFYSGLDELGLSLTEAQAGQFLQYYKMLIEWNERMNLTAITEWDDVVTKHFLDSLCLVKAVPDPEGLRMLDLGTGAGFPGIPLKILFPGLDVVLVDSVGKKINFVNAVIEKLGLVCGEDSPDAGAVTVHGRAEDLARDPALRQRFDLCVSRAVADLAVLAEYALPFVRTGGCFIAYKSADADTECAHAKKAVSLLGGKTERILSYGLPGTGEARSLVCIRKEEETPRVYPRKAGTPAKAPLSQ